MWEEIKRHLILYVQATLALAMMLSLPSCDGRKSECSETEKFRMNLLAGQTSMWYNTSLKIRSKQGPSKELDSAVLTNYFPMFLGLSKLGETKTNIPKTAHFRFAAKIFAENNPEISAAVWNLTKTDFTILLSSGLLESYGFDVKDLNSYARFKEAREAYFSELKNNDPNK